MKRKRIRTPIAWYLSNPPEDKVSEWVWLKASNGYWREFHLYYNAEKDYIHPVHYFNTESPLTYYPQRVGYWTFTPIYNKNNKWYLKAHQILLTAKFANYSHISEGRWND